MLNLAILVSGGGTNLQSIIDNIKSGYLNRCKISIVISNKEGAYALTRAKDNNIEAVIVTKNSKTVEEFDNEILGILENHKIDLIVLAGFLSILGNDFIDTYKNRIINIHPSLIPAFSGEGYYGLIPHKEAIEYGVKITGATVHFVNILADNGPIIFQQAVQVFDNDTPQILQRRVMEEAECIILPKAIKYISENRLKIEGRRVLINEK